MEQLERFDIAARAEQPLNVDYSLSGARLGGMTEADPRQVLGAGPADSTDPRAAFRKSEIDYVNRTSAVVQKGDTVEKMARRQAAANGEPDNWRAYQTLALANNDFSLDQKGNPIIHKGDAVYFGDTSLYGAQGMDKLNQAGGKFTAWNTNKTAEHHQLLAAQERQRIDNLYAAAGRAAERERRTAMPIWRPRPVRPTHRAASTRASTTASWRHRWMVGPPAKGHSAAANH